ncbi:M10 family metallopeptidase C-terminal domain-containing protein [Paracoccus fontiphilus]|uniref:Calcium-binding protein n=1 Tax=Paracoccus fontiphilus TaxID=1815556 RepID=A0ABV7IAJ0_9RHOB
MTTFRIAAQTIRFRDIDDDASSIISVKAGALSAFVNSASARFSYAPLPGYPGDDWPDVSVNLPSELQLTDDKGRLIDLGKTHAFLGSVVYDGRQSTFLFIEEEISGITYDGYMIHLGGDPLPTFRTVMDATNFLYSASLSRVTSGPFAPGRDIAFSAIPGRQVTENDRLLGTLDQDDFFGGTGNDTLLGNGGNDALDGGAGHDHLDGGAGNNVLRGGAGHDTLLGGAGQDSLFGDADNDLLTGAVGNDRLDGGAGADTMRGGTGNDIYLVDHARDLVVEAASQGIDTVHSRVTMQLSPHVENLVLTGQAAINGTGNALANRLTGQAGANQLTGGAGNDVLNGMAGQDTVNGGAGSDILYGGMDAARDVFVFNTVADSAAGAGRDRIMDFRPGVDDIDLRALDAENRIAGNQAFDFSGGTADANAVWFVKTGAGLILRADVNGDRLADFEIALTGQGSLTESDILL